MSEVSNSQKVKLTINILWANIFSIILIVPVFLIFGIPFYFIWIYTGDFVFGGYDIFDMFLLMDTSLWLLFFILISGIVLHELLHGLTWSVFAPKGFKSITFGIIWKWLTPYCHCKEPLKVYAYILGAIMPAVILGFIPAILSLFTGHVGLLLFGVFFTIAAAGDFLTIQLLFKENWNDLVQDHPSEAGCYVYRASQHSE